MEEKIAFWSTLCYTFLITGMMIGFGLLFQKRPPKNINNLYGYRTRMSMKNEKTWVLPINMREGFGFTAGLPAYAFPLSPCFASAIPPASKLFRQF